MTHRRSGMRRTRWHAAALAALVARTAAAQPTTPDGPRDTTVRVQADSLRAHASARAAQADFERRRRYLLPVLHGPGGRCDVQIGRWCYWYDEQEPHVPDEPAAIARARDDLIARLDRAARALPGDGWIAAQRIRYLVEAGRPAEAADAARACAADAAWCSALLGLARHAGDDPVGAERAFDDALAAMPADSACRWLDPRPIVPRNAADALGPPCTPGDTIVARFWWEATPFLTRGANDRRSEHLARRVLSRVFAGSHTPYAARWTDDLDELLMRYGWPDRWSRRNASPTAATSIDPVGHEPWPAYRFTPDATPIAHGPGHPASITDRAAHERWAPGFARHVVALDVAASGFRRGDSLRVVAVADAPPDSLRAMHDSVALVIAPFRALATTARVAMRDGQIAASAVAPASPALVGLEALDDTAVALRGRTAVALPELDRGFGISDLLLVAAAPDRSMPASLDEAMIAAVPPTAGAGDAIGVFWELYGLADGAQTVHVALHVETPSPGWRARAAARLRGRAPGSPPRLRWTDVGRGGAVAPRALLLDAALLPPGRHEIVVEVRHPDGRSARARRAVAVRRR